jgi:hypothetical protein
MERLPTVAPSCSLSSLELREQLERYKAAGDGAQVVEWSRRRRVIQVSGATPDRLIDQLIETERACCPFFVLTWDPTSRCLAIAVSDAEHEPALDAIGYALSVTEQVAATSPSEPPSAGSR